MTPTSLLTDLLGWPLLHFIWQGALIGSVCAILLALTRNARPQLRYLIACVAMLLCLLWPLFGVLQQWQEPQALSLEAAILLASKASIMLDVIWIKQTWLASQLDTYLPLFVSLWSMGVLLMLMRLALGLLWVYRLGQHGHDIAVFTQQWQAHTNQLAHQFAIRRHVQLRFQKDLLSPLTYGCLKPVVIMPTSLLTGMSPELIEALLAHEMAHIKRWDYVVNFVQNIVLSLLFYHPAVWWISKRIDTERELIADDMAASMLGQTRPLARALQVLDKLQLSGMSAAVMPAALAANGGDLLTRIKRLVRPDAQAWHWKMAAPVLGVVAALLLVLQSQVIAAPEPVGPKPAAPLVSSAAPLNFHVKTSSGHVLVLDEQSGKVLLEKDADTIVPIASLSKLVTAMVIFDAKQDMHERITLSKENLAAWQNTQVKLAIGTVLSRQTLLELMLIPSSNAATKALARNYPGGLPAFTRALQQKTASLGLRATYLDEAAGMSENNRSSARDIARLVAASAHYPELRKLSSRSEGQYVLAGRTHAYQSTNQLTASKEWEISLSKTGYSKNAGRCLSMRTIIAGKPIIMVLLNAKNSDVRLEDIVHIRSALESAS